MRKRLLSDKVTKYKLFRIQNQMRFLQILSDSSQKMVFSYFLSSFCEQTPKEPLQYYHLSIPKPSKPPRIPKNTIQNEHELPIFPNKFNSHLFLQLIDALPEQVQPLHPFLHQKQQKNNKHQSQKSPHLDTKYPIVKQAAIALEYQIGQDVYSLLWTDHALTNNQIRKEQPTTKVNHIPEITQITRKNKMAIGLNLLRVHYPKEYGFYPETWVLPADFHKIMKKHTKGKIYIVKPENGCQGQGIYLLDNPSRLQRQANGVVQEYLMNPLLINGLKFDLRIYVLITCVSPLRIYIYKDGIVRFATDKFEKPSENNLDNTFSHLTNYAINKYSDKFVVDQENPDNSHKRLITDVFKNAEYDQLMEKVSKIVIKTVISGLPAMQNAYTQCKKNDPSSCFQLLGFDIILNDKRQPILLQVNQNPSLVTDTPLDYKLKLELVKNIIEMTTGGYSTFTEQKIEIKVKLKDKHQIANQGNFSKIYPCSTLEQTESYDEFMQKAHYLYKDKFGINIVRTIRKSRQSSRIQQQPVLWNEHPLHYTKDKVQKVYGVRQAKTSSFKKRLIFI